MVNGLLARAVVRDWAADFICAQIRGAAGEFVVDAGQPDSGIHRGGAGAQVEIEVRGVVKRARIGSGMRWAPRASR